MGTLPQPAAATLKNLHKFVRLISLLFEGRVRYRLYPQRNELKSPCRYLDIYIHRCWPGCDDKCGGHFAAITRANTLGSVN